MPTQQACEILGGGPAGLSVAYYAHAAKLPFRLFEKSRALGGHCRTFDCGAHRYDAGAHRFHDRDAEITRDVQTLLGDQLLRVAAPSQVLLHGRFLDFPPRPLNWLRAAGPLEASRAVVEFLWSRTRHRPERTFEDLVATRYGLRLGRPLLLDYSEKLWGLPAAELAPEVATRRLSGMRLAQLLTDVVRPRSNSSHLDGSFYYPRNGYGVIADHLAAALPEENVHLGAEVDGLATADRRIRAVRFADGHEVEVEGRVVNTLPLTLLVRLLQHALPNEVHQAASGLRFRHVRLVFLRLNQAHISPNASIYLPDPGCIISRVSEPKNRSAAMAPMDETGLLAEVPCWREDSIAQLPDAALAERVIDDLTGAGLLRAANVLEWRHHWLSNAYPVYSLDYRTRVDTIVRGLAGLTNLDLVGRGGRFWYSHLHDQLRSAKDYVRSSTAADLR